jgi:hypothetical protein
MDTGREERIDEVGGITNKSVVVACVLVCEVAVVGCAVCASGDEFGVLFHVALDARDELELIEVMFSE